MRDENTKRAAEILLIDDNRGDTLLVMRAFEEAGIATHLSVAESAERALDLLRGEGRDAYMPDLILLDLNLPKMHGHEFLKIVKADPRLRHLPVVILSSSQAMPDVVESYAQYASGYIVKPAAFDQFRKLAATVRDYYFKLATLPDAGAAHNGERHAKRTAF